MSELDNDALYFKGILQVEVALEALKFSGINLPMELTLKSIIDFYESIDTSEGQEGFEVALQGEVYDNNRADVLYSLGQLAANRTTAGELRVAAEALREIL